MAARAHGGTSLAEELGLAEGMRVGLDDPPPAFVGLHLLPVPAGITMHTHLRGNMDVVIGFYRTRAHIERRLPVLRRRIDDSGAIWVAWPKATARVPTDLDEDVVRDTVGSADLTAAGACDIDDMWRGLRFEVAGSEAGSEAGSGG